MAESCHECSSIPSYLPIFARLKPLWKMNAQAMLSASKSRHVGSIWSTVRSACDFARPTNNLWQSGPPPSAPYLRLPAALSRSGQVHPITPAPLQPQLHRSRELRKTYQTLQGSMSTTARQCLRRTRQSLCGRRGTASYSNSWKLCRPFAREDRWQSLCQNLQIQPKRPVIDVLHIQFHPSSECG